MIYLECFFFAPLKLIFIALSQRISLYCLKIKYITSVSSPLKEIDILNDAYASIYWDILALVISKCFTNSPLSKQFIFIVFFPFHQAFISQYFRKYCSHKASFLLFILFGFLH